MTNTMIGSVEAVEEIGPKMSGTVTILNEKYGQITDENGGTHMFYPTFLKSIDSYSRDGKSGEALLKDFSNYQVGTKVIFNLSSTAGNKDISHVIVDTSNGVENLVPKTEANIATVLDGANNSVENMGPRITGVIKVMKLNEANKSLSFGFITPTAEGYEKNIYFYMPACVGGMEAFETLYKAHLAGNQMKVSFNVRDSGQGPSAYNVAIETV